MKKAVIEFEPSWGYASESVWVTKKSEGYILENSPFYAFGYSYQYKINVTENDEGELVVVGRKTWGGHCTYRLAISFSVGDKWKELWREVESLGGSYEESLFNNLRLLSVDIVPDADLKSIYSLFEKGERLKLWEFEEADIGEWSSS